MDLYCCESSANEVKAYDDPTLLQDRVLKNLLKTEDRYVIPYTSSFTVQQEVTPEMRKIVAEWMMEVRSLNPADGWFTLYGSVNIVFTI